MRKMNKNLILGAAALAVAFGAGSCGGGGGNEQGVSFTLLGFFEVLPEDQCEPLQGFVTRESTTLSESQDENGESTGGTVTTVIGMQNNLTSQFIRTQRVFLSFFNHSDASVALATIKAHAGEIRYKLGAKIRDQARIVPHLEFFVDDTSAYVERMDKLFDQISKEPRQPDEGE